MISSISWVPKGVSRTVPTAAEPPSNEKIEELLKSGVLETRGESENEENDEDMNVDAVSQEDELSRALSAASALGKASKSSKMESDSLADALKELDMDNYDEDDDGVELFGSGLGNLYYPSNDMDPYLKGQDEEDSEEEEDITIKPEDAVIVCARNEDDVSHLEVWILEDPTNGDSNMYVHHIVIPTFPLCTAWLGRPLKGGEKGNFIAIGSMEPAIEIWDVDIVSLENGTVTGFDIRKASSNASSQPEPSFTIHAHDKAVCTIAYNISVPNLLATGSEDKMVKLWDLSNQPTCIASKNPKAGAVFSVSFSEDCPLTLAIGGSKGKLQVWDLLTDAEIARRYGKYANKAKSST
ncbi:Transducin/WD40 repeat-like superfamily protein [Striga hermonthica]|uniref:Transducin/WD40 repeat-like superfamily protein n=1 Tax=Striga hermonthica TaxID=68872 RepID=A0A9N7MQ51_STRHE|nr:Transducin/WD40 repeat-like superfamily protein [Striga hermonthica]